MRKAFSKAFLVTSAAVGALSSGVLQAEEAKLVQTNLVSDIAGLAVVTDANLKNPWGVSHSPTSPFWVSNQGTSTATLYMVTDETDVTKLALTVAIPKTAAGPQGPTGQVNNTNTECFPVSVSSGGDGKSAHFIFANLNGTISAWDMGPMAFVQAMGTTGTVYTGLAINGGQTRLYAANTSLGRIDFYDCSFKPVNLGSDAFVDPTLPKGLVPFNVQDIGGDIYVVYAPPGRAAEISADHGQGAVAIFDEDGNFIKELVAGSNLAAPWGITIAPPGFRRFSNDCWSATSALSTAKSTPSSRATENCTGRSQSTPAKTSQAAFGRSSSGSAATTAAPMFFTLLTGSTARRMGYSAP